MSTMSPSCGSWRRNARRFVPCDERHHEEQRVVVAAEVVDGHDGRVVHLRDQLRLALEALLGLGAQLGRRDQLDGDLAIEPRVAGAVDDAHAAAAQFRDDLVPLRETAAQHRPSRSSRTHL